MILDALFFLVQAGLQLFFWAVIIAAIMSMLIGFNVLDTRNRMVWTLADFFARVTEPAMRALLGPSGGEGIEVLTIALSTSRLASGGR